MSEAYQHEIHFTLDEARNILPSIIPSLAEMRELKRQLDEKGYDLRIHRYFGGMGPNGLRVYPEAMEALVEIVKELNDRGIVLKDIERGLIDFPCVRSNGEEVYLCYYLGEPTINFWHRISDGFPGRESVDTL